MQVPPLPLQSLMLQRGRSNRSLTRSLHRRRSSRRLTSQRTEVSVGSGGSATSRRLTVIKPALANAFAPYASSATAAAADDEFASHSPALLCLRPGHPLRKLLARVLAHPAYRAFMVAVILLTCVMVALQTPTLSKDDSLYQVRV